MEYCFTSENFDAEVLNSDIPVLVDFYADWCGPCKMMAPVIEKLAEEYDGRIRVGKCNVDDNMELSEKYKVFNIPNMQLFKGGQVAETFVGAMTKEALREKLESAL